MRKFIPLSTFNELYSSQSELLTESGIDSFREKLVSDGMRIAQSAGFSTGDFQSFQKTLGDPSSIVFYGWIEQNVALKNMLLGRGLSLYVDAAKNLEHSLSEHFTDFVSPALSEELLRVQINSDTERKYAFSFVQLLNEHYRAVVEDQLFSPLHKRLNHMKGSTKIVDDEQELVNLVKPMCSDDIIESVNYLSRASYATKLGYVDDILDSIHSKACTVRFANWVLERMSHVQLNKEHLYKLTDLRTELRRGNLSVKNHKKGKTPIRFGPILTILLVSILIGGTIYLLAYKPFSEVEDHEFSNKTSFQEFTKEERVRMDSLLRVMDNPFDKPEEDDPLTRRIQTGVDVDLVLRKSFTNQLMESIYEDLMKDVELKDIYADSVCTNENLIAFQSARSIGSLEKMSGVHKTLIRNESDYAVVLYVADNNKSGKVYASMLQPNETIEFGMNKFNTLLMVAGNQYQRYVAPAKSTPDEHPSKKFTHHFCDTDWNYEETINTAYQMKNPRSGKNKLMIMGAKSGYVHLVDVHGVLEAY